MRDTYRERRDALVAAVAESFDGAAVTGLDAGHHALLRLPDGVDEGQVVSAAAAVGIAVRGLSDYRVAADDDAPAAPLPPALVIGFGNVTAREIRDGIAVLGKLVSAELARR